MPTSLDNLKDFKSIIDYYRINEDKLRNHGQLIKFLFGALTLNEILSREVVLYGSGQFGRQVNRILKLIGVNPACYVSSFAGDNEPYIDGLRVIDINQLYDQKRNVIILVTSPFHAASIKKQLLFKGFSFSNIYFPINVDPYAELFFGNANYFVLQCLVENLKKYNSIETMIEKYSKIAEQVSKAIFDEKSKNLLWAIVVQTVFWDNIETFRLFMSSYSEPIRIFGTRPFDEYGPENYFYFNNDVFELADDEVYIDIGAFDGDSINEFIISNEIRNLSYRKIIAFEPDPINYANLSRNINSNEKIVLTKLGVSNKIGFTRFLSSGFSASPTGGAISIEGDIDVQLVSLDDYLNEEKISLIKMDPPGDQISLNILSGATKNILKHRPKIIIGIHSLEELYDLVSKVTSSFAFYNLYLRHNSWGIGEVDLYLIPKLEK